MIKIYVLTFDNNVIYVGKTTQELAKRRRSHIGSKHCPRLRLYLKQLTKSERRRVIIEEIDNCTLDMQAAIEVYWIHQFKAWGFTLHNINYVSGKGHRLKKEKLFI